MQFARLSKRLQGISHASQQGYPIRNLYRLMYLPELWYEAYAKIYQNRGALTPGIDEDTFDGMSKSRIEAIIKPLRDDTYRPKPVRRTYIPKKNGTLRPLSIPSGTDKLVQEVTRIILERIYEPIFTDTAHGFRPRRSCHTALESIQRKWNGTKWFIEFDIKGFFDNMSHHVMLRILKKKIDDRRFLKLIRAMMEAGYLEDWRYNRTYSGVPQGGIVSPILSNIYLAELDEFVKSLKGEFDKGKQRTPNPEYKSICDRKHYLRKKIKAEGKQPQYLSELKELTKRQQSLPSKDQYGDDFKRLNYCRYADDFVLGVIGSKAEAATIMQRITEFLRTELALAISPEKTKIQSAKEGIQFLSYQIVTYVGARIKKIKVNGTLATRRTLTEQIQLRVPDHKALEYCNKYRYGDWQTTKPTHRASLAEGSALEIVDTYNAELRGLAQYYALAADMKLKLKKLNYLAVYSLFKTLANKYRCKKREIITNLKSGNDYVLRYEVKGERKGRVVFQIKHIQRKPQQIRDAYPKETVYLTTNSSELVRRMAAEICESCGATERSYEVHHVRKLKDLKEKKHLSYWEKVMLARQRKTLVLCQECHDLLHAGKLPDRRYPARV